MGKICPLRMVNGSDMNSLAECIGERCAWWNGEACAVVANSIVKAVIANEII